ncbi:hypothetical protein J6590_063058 [Homalodisca vitripennis]|nr:hypothetical protein J6590_063058 [Homalodisca vitripennis]
MVPPSGGYPCLEYFPPHSFLKAKATEEERSCAALVWATCYRRSTFTTSRALSTISSTLRPRALSPTWGSSSSSCVLERFFFEYYLDPYFLFVTTVAMSSNMLTLRCVNRQ